jgi:predicted porin
MKKTLFAVAAATALTGAAQAQSSVTVYGLYDGGYLFSNKEFNSSNNVKTITTSGSFAGNASASSRIGFRGMEDLGGGLAATFNLEIGISPGTGGLTTTSATGIGGQSDTGIRTSVVGLSHKQWGSVSIGRQLTGIHGVLAGDIWGGNNMVGDMTYSNFTGTDTGSNTQAGTNGVSTRVHLDAVRANNLVAYTTPNMSGLVLRADYSNDRATSISTPGANVGNMGLSGIYTNGPLIVKAATHKVIANVTAVTPTTSTINAASISYKIAGAMVQYTYGSVKQENNLSVQTYKYSANKLSANYQMGKITPFVQFGLGNSEEAANTGKADDKGYQIGAEYALSKRSNLYAAYANQERKIQNSAEKVTQTQMAVGLRHTF